MQIAPARTLGKSHGPGTHLCSALCSAVPVIHAASAETDRMRSVSGGLQAMFDVGRGLLDFEPWAVCSWMVWSSQVSGLGQGGSLLTS